MPNNCSSSGSLTLLKSCIFNEDEVKLALYTTKNKFSLSFHHHHHISFVFPPLPPSPHCYCFPTTTSTFLLFSLHSHLISIVFLPPPPRFYRFPSTTATFLSFSFHHHHVSIVFLPPPPRFYRFPSTTATFLLFSFHHHRVSIVLTPQLYCFLPSPPFARGTIHSPKRFSHPLVTDVNRELKQQRRLRLQKRHFKSEFKLYHAYSIPFTSSNVGQCFWS